MAQDGATLKTRGTTPTIITTHEASWFSPFPFHFNLPLKKPRYPCVVAIIWINRPIRASWPQLTCLCVLITSKGCVKTAAVYCSRSTRYQTLIPYTIRSKNLPCLKKHQRGRQSGNLIGYHDAWCSNGVWLFHTPSNTQLKMEHLVALWATIHATR